MSTEKEILNSYVDQKNSLMLAVLGLYETLELFRMSMKQDFWIEYDTLMLEHDIVLSILGWGDGVIKYVD